MPTDPVQDADGELDVGAESADAPLRTRGFDLAPWQEAAVRAWVAGAGSPNRGTLEIVTGGGKTLIALACAERVATVVPDLKVAVVVPTEALARQWVANVLRYTTLEAGDVGLLGAGKRGTFRNRRVLVAVLNSAAKRLPDLAREAQPLMLIVDECHRAGAPTFSQVLDTVAPYRLGLSATPDREELDDEGEPLRYDEQRVGQALGRVVFRFSLRDAREAGWLPDYDLHHHGLTLTPDERQRYDALSRQIDDLADKMQSVGLDRQVALRRSATGDGDDARLAQAYVAKVSLRKDLLYRATERRRVAVRLVEQALGEAASRRVLMFHERVDEADVIFDDLRQSAGDRVVVEHSRLPDRERQRALDDFRSGAARVLVSVKSLVEGIDVPEADVGVSVASTSSVRQRVQALGRVLRRQVDADAVAPKHADMHLLYVADTVDELIYAKEDWSDLTGEGANGYWRWPLDPLAPPEQMPGPPATPRPTEDQELERLGTTYVEQPQPWLGAVTGHEYSVDVMANVTNSFGVAITNPQGVADMVLAVRGRPGGRFRVTPMHRFVLVWRADEDGAAAFVAGRLAEPFVAEVLDAGADRGQDEAVATHDLRPGDPYEGPGDSDGGTYKLSQKSGGVIQRRVPGGVEFALTTASGDPDLEQNARRVLDAWRQAIAHGVDFSVNAVGHAWYRASGQRRFLASVPGGFAWPSDTGRGD